MNEHVGRLDVSVDNVHRGEVLTGDGNLVSGFPPVKIIVFFNHLFKRTSFTVLGNDVVVVDGGVDIYESESVGMINFFKNPDLGFQESLTIRFDIIQIDNLNGNYFPLIVVLVAAIDCTGETASDDVVQFVTVGSNPLFRIPRGVFTVLLSI